MRAKRLVLSSCLAAVIVIGLVFTLALLDDAYSPALPPAFFRYGVLVVAWPFALTSALLHHDPPPGICWWVLLALAGLFWGAVTECLFRLRNARKP
jgi:hypothetical protein